MTKTSVAFLLVFSLTAAGARADAQADAAQKLSKLPPPPLVITTDTAAGSPSVALNDRGAVINKTGDPVPYDQVLVKLAGLSKESFPCGRVIFFSSSNAPKAESDKVEADLQNAGFRLIRQ